MLAWTRRDLPVLTGDAASGAMTKVTVAPITTTIKGLSSEVRAGRENELDLDSVVALDTVITVSVDRMGGTLGHLSAEREIQLARAVVVAYDLEVRLLA